MTDINKQEQSEEQAGLKSLASPIKFSQGHFKLSVVRCNYRKLQSDLIDKLQELVLPIKLELLELNSQDRSLLRRIEQEFGETTVESLAVVGLENLENLGYFLVSLNQTRDSFAVKCKFPLLLWMNDDIYKQLARIAPDFESWSTNHQFVFPTENLWQQLRDGVKEFFDNTFARQQVSGFYRRLKNMQVGYLQRQELNFALQELVAIGRELSAELQTDLDFIEAIEKHGTEQGLAYLKKCEEFWQNALQQENCTGDCRLKLGLTRFYLGGYCLYQKKQGIAEEQQREYWQQANSLYKSSIELFQAEQRDDLVAKVITDRERALQRLGLWDELKIVAEEAKILHKKHYSQHKLAQDYRFLAEVALAKAKEALAKKDYVNCKNLANKGKNLAQRGYFIFNNVPLQQQERWDAGLYYLLLGQAERYLGNLDASLRYLETAKNLGDLGHPRIFLRILEELRSIYLEKKDYLAAFDIKKLQLEVKHKYGLKAFIGAGYLSSCKQEETPFNVDQVEKIATEILKSQRSSDVAELVNKIVSNDPKLIVIHGVSGVGKSSLIQGGLIPALIQPNSLYENVPVYVRNYENWIDKLGSSLQNAMTKQGKSPANLTTLKDILGELRSGQNCYRRTILIFDQFEEFFFNNQVSQRQEFFKFISECLNLKTDVDTDAVTDAVTYVRIVLSLREDYLHYLLELDPLNKIDQGILGEKNRYRLNNFSLNNAKAVIKNLTGMAGLTFPPDLIDELVKELGAESGEVRPIELQIVGTQLETENIKTLKKYKSEGPLENFVNRYLEAVIEDCGPENKQIAETLLYFLTDKEVPRPRKTRRELKKDLHIAKISTTKDQLDLIFTVFLGSGLVILLPGTPMDRYQLVHDYLAKLISKDIEPRLKSLMTQLEEEKKQKELAVISIAFALINYSNLLSTNRKTFEALLESLKAASQLKNNNLQKDKSLCVAVAISIQNAMNEMNKGPNLYNRIEGDTQVIRSVSFSPDGKTIASASDDNTIKLWDYKGKLLHTLTGHGDIVRSVSFRSDGEIIASASDDNTIKLWDYKGKLLHTLTGHGDSVRSVSFSPDGKTIASASSDNTVKLWDDKGNFIKTLTGHDKTVNSVSFSPDGKTIASASSDNTVKLWDDKGNFIKTLTGHDKTVNSVSFSPDGKTIASASDDNTIKLWDDKGNDLKKPLTGHKKSVRSVSFCPDGKTIASASSDKTVKLWDYEGKLLHTLSDHFNSVISVSFSPDGKTIVSATYGIVNLWNYQYNIPNTLVYHSDDSVNSVSFSPDGKIIASASSDYTVKLWNYEGNEINPLPMRHANSVNSVSFSPDGKIIASASDDDTVKLWDDEGNEIKPLTGHTNSVNSVSFSPDGKTIASASSDKTVRLWDYEGNEIKPLTGHSNSVNSVSFSPDGKTIASASSDNTVKLWDYEGNEIKTLPMRHANSVNSVSFSPDGKIIASASSDNTVKLWDYEGNEIKTLTGHSNSVNSVSFSPDGKIIASASSDKTVKLWDDKGKLLNTLTGHDESVMSVSFGPDKDKNTMTIASASEDNTVKLWNLNLKYLQEKSCEYLHDYLVTHPEVLAELTACQNKLILEDATSDDILSQATSLIKEDSINDAFNKLNLAK